MAGKQSPQTSKHLCDRPDRGREVDHPSLGSRLWTKYVRGIFRMDQHLGWGRGPRLVPRRYGDPSCRVRFCGEQIIWSVALFGGIKLPRWTRRGPSRSRRGHFEHRRSYRCGIPRDGLARGPDGLQVVRSWGFESANSICWKGRCAIEQVVVKDEHGSPVCVRQSQKRVAERWPYRQVLWLSLRSTWLGLGLTGADLDAHVFVAPAGGLLRQDNWRREVWCQPRAAGFREGSATRVSRFASCRRDRPCWRWSDPKTVAGSARPLRRSYYFADLCIGSGGTRQGGCRTAR